VDILSFRFGIRIPTTRYSLLMVAEQPALPARTVWGERDPRTGKAMIHRNWTFSPGYLATLRRAAERFIAEQRDLVAGSRFFPEWEKSLATAAHHSGTARMSVTPATGVCDRDARVHGLANVYVCDGSLIPASGVANTGLTIAALALRLAGHIRGS
jgi:choline dehydrogenase-like flavoprotein